jgi:hypothetical protein
VSNVNYNQQALEPLADYFISNNTITMNGSDKVDRRASHSRGMEGPLPSRGVIYASGDLPIDKFPPHFADGELPLPVSAPAVAYFEQRSLIGAFG